VEIEEGLARKFAAVAVRRLGQRQLRLLQVIMPDRSEVLSSGLSLEEEEELSQRVHRHLAN
jgi:hypothetical protein